MLPMTDNSIIIKTPHDVQRLAQKVLNVILRSGEESQIQNSGKIYNLGMLWLKAFEMSKLCDLEQRIADVEDQLKESGGI